MLGNGPAVDEWEGGGAVKEEIKTKMTLMAQSCLMAGVCIMYRDTNVTAVGVSILPQGDLI